jgi:hypothetical protein
MRQHTTGVDYVGVGQRRILVVEATPQEIGNLVSAIAQESIEFTFDPLPDGFYRISVKPDQTATLRRTFALAVLG